jgi:O-antigen/teichoic acid export membrane protein
MQRGSFGYTILKAAVAIAFWFIVAGILWLLVWPLRRSIEGWGLWAGAACGAVLLTIGWFVDKWLDRVNARREARFGDIP